MADNQQLQPVPSFDPDAYVASHQASGFNPDAYIVQANGGFDPNKYLDDSHTDLANDVLARHHAGEAELDDASLKGLIEQAYKGRTPGQGIIDWAKGVGGGIKQEAMHAMFPSWYPESGVAEKIKSGISTAGKAAGEFGDMVGTIGEQELSSPEKEKASFSAAKNLVAGAASAPLDILNAGQSLGVGAANMLDANNERRIDRIVRSEKLSHDINASVKGVNEYLGADPSDPLNESTRFLAQAFLPIKGVGEISGPIAKAADMAIENAPKAARWGAPAVGGAVAMATGHPTLAKEIVAAGYGLPTTVKTIRTVIKKVKEAAGDTTPESTSLFNDFVDAASKAPSQTPMFTYIKQGVDDRIASLQKVTEDFRSANQGKIKFADDSTVDIKDLKGPDKELREKLDQLKFLQQRSDNLKTASDVNKVLTYGGKLSLATAGNVVAGGAIMGGISASQAQPQQVEQAAKEGFQTGAALTLPFAPAQAAGALKDIRMSQGRDALASRGEKIVDPTSLQGLTDAQKTNVLTTAGAAGAVGVKTVVLPPEDYAKMTAPQKPSVVPSVEGAPQEQQVPQQAPNGHYDSATKTIYLNRDAIGEGTAGHELQHPLQQLWGSILRESSPESMAEFEKIYDAELAKTGQTRGLSTRAERDAEIGRELLRRTPIEAFYRGENGADVVKRVASNLLQRIMPDRYAKTIGTTELGAPYSRGDLGEMRQRMFRLGEEAAKPPTTAPSEPGAASIRSNEQTQPNATTEAPPKSVEQVVSEVDKAARPQVIPAGEANPQEAVDFLVTMGQTPENAAAKAQAAVQDLRTQGSPVTLENIVKKALQRAVPKPADVVDEVDQVAKTIPQNETPQQTATAPPPESQAPSTSESGVAGEVQTPPAQAGHPDYDSIRTEAENAKREELVGTRRKTKEQEISRAGLEAMAQSHAGHVGDTDLVTWRTNKYGKPSISGRRIDPSDPFHAHLLEEANLSPDDVKKLNFIESNMGKTLTADYLHAPEEGEASGVTRRVEQAESGATERVSGEAASRRLSKSFVPAGFTFNAPSKTFEVNGFSPDKFLNNAQMLIPWAKANGLKAWKNINDPSFPQDFQNGVENHKNGFTFAGKPIEGTPLTRVKPNPDYEPHVLSKDKADLLNAMMGDTSAKVTEKKQAPYREAAKADKQILAQQNSPYWEPQAGEVNRIRAKLSDNAKLLESTFETLRPELIDNLRTTPVGDEQTLRPSGFEGDRGAFAEKGTPNSTFAGAGFMPSTHPQVNTPEFKRWFGESKIKDEQGNPMPLYHGTTRLFTSFDPSKGNIENDFGRAIYLSNTPEDIAINYAGVGPDLTNRIERRMENLVDDTRDETPIEVAERLGISKREARIVASTPKYDSPEYRQRQKILRDVAKKEMTEHSGATMKVFAKMENPLELGGKNELYWDIEYPTYKDGEYIEGEEPTGKMIDFIQAIRDVSSQYQDADPNPALENFFDGGKPSEIIQALRDSREFNMATDPETGDIASSQIIGEALQKMGYDGIIDRQVNKKFGSERKTGKQMQGMTADTAHYVAFDPKQIKSATGNRGTFDPNSPDIAFMPATPKHLDAVAKELGLRYDGPSLGGKAHQFTDDKTKSSIDVPADATPEQIRAVFEESRKLFKEPPIQFMPKTGDKQAIKMAAVKFPDGKIYEDWFHPSAFAEGVSHYSIDQLSRWIQKHGERDYIQTGFVTNGGEFLDRKEALARAQSIGQVTNEGLQEAKEYFGDLRGPNNLEALNFTRARQFHKGGAVKIPKIAKPLSRVKVKQKPRAVSSNAA